MQAHRIGALLLTVAIGLTACGNGDGDLVESTKASDPEQPASAPGESIAVKTADSPLGEILVGPDGLTLYGFTQDSDGVPTCAGDCATAWPALLVDGEPIIGEGLDPATFSTVDGAEEGTQLKAGNWPLYRFSGDAAPGDVNGQGSGGVWFAVRADGTLVDA